MPHKRRAARENSGLKGAILSRSAWPKPGAGRLCRGNRVKQKIAKMCHREPQRGVAIHAARPRLPPMAIVAQRHGLPRRCAPRNDSSTEARSAMARGVGGWDRFFYAVARAACAQGRNPSVRRACGGRAPRYAGIDARLRWHDGQRGGAGANPFACTHGIATPPASARSQFPRRDWPRPPSLGPASFAARRGRFDGAIAG